jgi:protein-disulfide isomerase
MDKKFWLVIVAIAAVFIGILYFGGNKNKDNSSGGASVAATNHVKGKLDSKVTLVEYGDFQCPVCGAYYPLVTQVVEKYHDKIKFQFRNLPLSQVHNHAFAAARAAEAASEQGKFWEMYDALFSNQQNWSKSNSAAELFKQYATQLGLDANKYQTDFSSDKVNKVINADVAAFKKTGDDMGTPTFYLNGKKIELSSLLGSDGNPSLDKFSAIIDKELQQQGQ